MRLTTQHEFSPDLAIIPNLFRYNGQMRSPETTRALTTRKHMDLGIRKWLGLKPGSKNIAWIGVYVVDSKRFKNLQTKSKYEHHFSLDLQPLD